jgi:phospholipid-translocating ATPase
MGESFRRSKGKIRWSELYSFSCFQPCTADLVPVQEHQLGQPGFSRLIFCNQPQLHKYPNNYVSTTKYNVVTFLPKSLFEQFHGVTNFYFLLAAVFSVANLAPFTPISLIAPLLFVVRISMLKEAVEDWQRFSQVTCCQLSSLLFFSVFNKCLSQKKLQCKQVKVI